MKRIIFLLHFTVLFNTILAQTNTTWCFGDSAGLSFSFPVPEPLLDCRVSSMEMSSSISDSVGNLLFYVGGFKEGSGPVHVRDKTHAVMANGDSLESHPSYTNGSIIVPKPGSSNEYYIFYIHSNWDVY